MTEHQVAHRICPVCEACCGLEIRHAQGKIISIRGHDADVFSAGYLCPKGVALKDLHEDPDRLRTPLIKRDGRFVEASWEAALAEVERRLMPVIEQHGRDAVALAIGNPTAHKLSLVLNVPRLVKALKSRNVYSALSLDNGPRHLASGLMFGHWMTVPVPDIERSDFLMVIGANPMVSNGSLWTVPDFRAKAKAMRARGGRLVVVDPRRTQTAAVADQHVFIRPGADVFLLAAMVHTLFDEGLVRLDRLAGMVNGVEAIRSATAAFSPERGAARCGVDAATLRDLARALAGAKAGCVYGRFGASAQEYGTPTNWLIDVLNTLSGHLDAPGGAMFPRGAGFAANTMGAPGVGRGIAYGKHRSRVSGWPEVFGELPMNCLAEEIETAGAGQVRALIAVASNPVSSAPNGARLARALDQLDFMVSLDIYLSETSRHADVILPGLSPFEDSHYDSYFEQFSHRNHVRYSPALFAPPEGQRTEWQAMLALIAILSGRGAAADVQALDDELVAERLHKQTAGLPPIETVQAELAQWSGPERLLDLSLRTGPYGDQFGRVPGGVTLRKVVDTEGGIDLGPLQPRLPEVLRTPSGKIELAPEMLLGDLARAWADIDRPVPPMVIVGRRDVRSNNSWLHNLPTLAKGPFRCTALLHPQDAERLGLRDGATARIKRGELAIEVQVELSADMMPGVISLPHGWGHDLPGVHLGVANQRPGVNLNDVLDETLFDPLSGCAVLNGVAVELSAVS
ncbi:MAG: molybdopterin-dependent oxidoreductase [Burkholderiales bacterium]